jgi:hypothetical protein
MKSKLLYKNQFGFMKNRSTIDAITKFISDILNGFENGEFTIGMFLDLSKAFDTINHDILLQKLNRYGIRGSALDWVNSYFKNRSQTVKIKDTDGETILSDYRKIRCGVPQGSVLGPLFFIVYINDITNCL